MYLNYNVILFILRTQYDIGRAMKLRTQLAVLIGLLVFGAGRLSFAQEPAAMCSGNLSPRSFVFWAPGLAAATNDHEVRLVTTGLQELDAWLVARGGVVSRIDMEGFWRDTETNTDVSLPGYFYVVQQAPDSNLTMLEVADRISFLFEAREPYVLDVSEPVRAGLFSASPVSESISDDAQGADGIAAESVTLFQVPCAEANTAALNTYLDTAFGGFSRVRNERADGCVYAYIVSTQGQDRRADISLRLSALGIDARLALAPVRRVTRTYTPSERAL